MILETSAVYHGKTDILQVAAFTSEDDGSSIQRLVKSGKVRVLHNNEDIFEVDFDQRSYSNGSGEEDNEGFYFFFFHPPLRQNLRAVVSLELLDGRTAQSIQPVQNESLVKRGQEAFANPSLANRPIIDHSGRNVELL
jgi:hypothetical protein